MTSWWLHAPLHCFFVVRTCSHYNVIITQNLKRTPYLERGRGGKQKPGLGKFRTTVYIGSFVRGYMCGGGAYKHIIRVMLLNMKQARGSWYTNNESRRSFTKIAMLDSK